jgi:ESCRT-II complex subunit VPS36
MNREAEKNSQTAAHLAVAFQDLDALMGMAAEMVKLAERFRGVMGPDGAITLSPSSHSSSSSSLSSLHAAAAAGGSSGSLLGTAEGANTAVGGAVAGTSSGEQLLLDSETQLQLIAMGITSPVTRASAGVRFQQELARQLADFLAAPLAKAGGVMMLPDVYCLFNRARGTELVSPDDLIQACDAFPQVKQQEEGGGGEGAGRRGSLRMCGIEQ